jgi:hypothetical protein
MCRARYILLEVEAARRCAMEVRGAGDLPGLTAQEIWDAHFRNELDEEEHTQAIAQTAGFLAERGYDVWEYRSPVSGGTTWRDGLNKVWFVDPTTGDIAQWAE